MPGDRACADELGLVLVRAMVAAAHADGRLDAEERRRLLERIAALDIDARERAELLAEIERPVRQAWGRPLGSHTMLESQGRVMGAVLAALAGAATLAFMRRRRAYLLRSAP